jgi:hypothetical protein
MATAMVSGVGIVLLQCCSFYFLIFAGFRGSFGVS